MVVDDVKPITEKVLYEVLHDVWAELMLPRFDEIEKRLHVLELDVKELKRDMVQVKADVQDIKRRVIDLERDAPSYADTQALSKRVEKLEHAVGL